MQKIKTYDSGLRVVVEQMSGFTSVSFNIYVGIGSIYEDETNQGISHLIEHMLFKGTKNRSAFQIAEDLKNIGALYNAFTSKTDTSFYSKTITEYTEKSVEILSDMLLNSAFNEKELAKEKKVVIEEMKMYKDDPGSLCNELADTNFYKDSPYASNIIGTKKSVMGISRQDIIDYMAKNYVPQNIVLSFAGNITYEEAIRLVEKYFNPLLQGENHIEKRFTKKLVRPQNPIAKLRFKDNAQSELCLMYPLVDMYDDKRHIALVLNHAWGSSANMGSRLFQIIREKMGLVYSIYSSVSTSEYGGDLSINFSTSTKNVPIALKGVKKAIDDLVKQGITQAEIDSAKINLKTGTLLKYENTNHIALSNARQLMFYGKIQSSEEYLEKINAVTVEDTNEMIKYIFDNTSYVISCVGKDKKINLLKEYNKNQEV